ncbi:hypothetical protein [Methylobacterium sp. J-077]|uniref:hypothetical protein n=1 Tax=Methylobacterium sp. J-077 TaxID=2836656 RepID=UPI001FBA01AE|nr:hypothetical protein [Methylobacterium sp. J-077]MCJ2122492.1 hypothetical protein [Methylobacterium sp. J-077]
MIDYAQARRMMVNCQLRTFHVNDNTVLDAFDTRAREAIIPKGREFIAYIDQILTVLISSGETACLPTPMVLDRMVPALTVRPGVAALDVVAGSGYAAAIMADLCAEVAALESVPGIPEIGCAAQRHRPGGVGTDCRRRVRARAIRRSPDQRRREGLATSAVEPA